MATQSTSEYLYDRDLKTGKPPSPETSPIPIEALQKLIYPYSTPEKLQQQQQQLTDEVNNAKSRTPSVEKSHPPLTVVDLTPPPNIQPQNKKDDKSPNKLKPKTNPIEQHYTSER